MAPSARRPLDGTGVRRISGRTFKIGTWNVRSLKSPEESFLIFVRKMDRLNIDILGMNKGKQSHGSVEEQWHQLKTRVHKINKEILNPDKWIAKEPWMTDKIYQLMEREDFIKIINTCIMKSTGKSGEKFVMPGTPGIVTNATI
ncbi:hypothetical protein ACJJTC_013047 [Scirpophaga incertulas]